MCAPLLPLTRRGAVTGADLWGKLLTLSPLYYVFLLQTRAYHFANTMRWGSASYYVTRRAVSISHAPLHELFMTYGRSHFYPAIELLLVLTVAIRPA